MALLKRYEKFETGESYQSAYHRVMLVGINATAGAAEVQIGIYRDEAARRDGKKPVMTGTCAATGDDFTELFADAVLGQADKSPLKQAYALLKRQSMYAGAQDI